jgi:hypothetical protein
VHRRRSSRSWTNPRYSEKSSCMRKDCFRLRTATTRAPSTAAPLRSRTVTVADTGRRELTPTPVVPASRRRVSAARGEGRKNGDEMRTSPAARIRTDPWRPCGRRPIPRRSRRLHPRDRVASSSTGSRAPRPCDSLAVRPDHATLDRAFARQPYLDLLPGRTPSTSRGRRQPLAVAVRSLVDRERPRSWSGWPPRLRSPGDRSSPVVHPTTPDAGLWYIPFAREPGSHPRRARATT